MRPSLLAVLAIAAFLSMTPLPVQAGWGSGGCSPVGGFAPQFAPVATMQPAFAQPIPVFSGWDDGPEGWRFQYQDGRVIAGYYPPTGEYRIRFGSEWSQPTRAPWEPVNQADAERRQQKCKCSDTCPCGRRCRCKAEGKACSAECTCAPKPQPKPAEEVGQVFFGVDAKKLTGQERYKINGRECSRKEVIDRLTGDGQLTDDSGKLRLTVIGADADRKQILADLANAPVLAPFKDKILVQDYLPTDWAPARVGFVTSGHPTICLQAPDGKILHRQDAYLGPDKLAEALRKVDPNYDPSKDPNVLNPAPAPSPAPGPATASWWEQIPNEVRWVGAAVLGFLGLAVVQGRKK